jgi:hypothetical protein
VLLVPESQDVLAVLEALAVLVHRARSWSWKSEHQRIPATTAGHFLLRSPSSGRMDRESNSMTTTNHRRADA